MCTQHSSQLQNIKNQPTALMSIIIIWNVNSTVDTTNLLDTVQSWPSYTVFPSQQLKSTQLIYVYYYLLLVTSINDPLLPPSWLPQSQSKDNTSINRKRQQNQRNRFPPSLYKTRNSPSSQNSRCSKSNMWTVLTPASQLLETK